MLLSAFAFTRNAILVLAETQSTSDQCPGSVSNLVTMRTVKYKNTSGNWVSTKCTNHPSNIGSGYGSLSTMCNNYYERWHKGQLIHNRFCDS